MTTNQDRSRVPCETPGKSRTHRRKFKALRVVGMPDQKSHGSLIGAESPTVQRRYSGAHKVKPMVERETVERAPAKQPEQKISIAVGSLMVNEAD